MLFEGGVNVARFERREMVVQPGVEGQRFVEPQRALQAAGEIKIFVALPLPSLLLIYA